MDIGLDARLDRETLHEAFRKILPGLNIPVVEDVSELPEAWDLWIMVLWDEDDGDVFSTVLTFAVPFLDGVDDELWYRDVARALSDELSVRSLFDGTPFGPYKSPYWSLIWDEGVPYLADDSEWHAENDEPGRLRIVKPLDQELFPRRRPDEMAACVDRSFQILQRADAIQRLAEARLSRMTKEEREEELEIMCLEAWDSHSEWQQLPDDVRREIDDDQMSEPAESARYDPVLMIWLRSELSVGTNDYLALLLFEELGLRVKVLGEAPDLTPCPCCGYASISRRGDFDICRVCWWEDDGQDNSCAEVNFGPNRDVTLTQARANFLRYELCDPRRTDLMVLRDPRLKYRKVRHFELSEDGRTIRELGTDWSSQAFRL